MKQKKIEKPVFPTNYFDEKGELTKQAMLYEIRLRRWVHEQDIELPPNSHNKGSETKNVLVEKNVSEKVL